MPFKKGNKLAKKANHGSHHSALELRDDLIKRVITNKEKINEALIRVAKKGNTQAIREIFDRTVGKSIEFIDVTSKGKVLPTPILNVLFDHNGNKKDNKPE